MAPAVTQQEFQFQREVDTKSWQKKRENSKNSLWCIWFEA